MKNPPDIVIHMLKLIMIGYDLMNIAQIMRNLLIY